MFDEECLICCFHGAANCSAHSHDLNSQLSDKYFRHFDSAKQMIMRLEPPLVNSKEQEQLAVLWRLLENHHLNIDSLVEMMDLIWFSCFVSYYKGQPVQAVSAAGIELAARIQQLEKRMSAMSIGADAQFFRRRMLDHLDEYGAGKAAPLCEAEQ
jgi:hypothetical protein